MQPNKNPIDVRNSIYFSSSTTTSVNKNIRSGKTDDRHDTAYQSETKQSERVFLDLSLLYYFRGEKVSRLEA